MHWVGVRSMAGVRDDVPVDPARTVDTSTGDTSTGDTSTADTSTASLADTASPTPDVEERPVRRRGGTVGDMVRSLAVVVAVVAAMVILIPRPSGTPAREVDYTQVVTQAVVAADYPVLAPDELPSGWRATSARVAEAPGEGSAWFHLGVLTASGEYAAVEQVDGSAEDRRRFVWDMTTEGQPAGTSLVAATAGRPGPATWDRLLRVSGEQERRSLLLPPADPDHPTVVVTGTASWQELEQLAGTLQLQG